MLADIYRAIEFMFAELVDAGEAGMTEELEDSKLVRRKSPVMKLILMRDCWFASLKWLIQI